nr:MAG TPA: hypothetical protein [Caudoviricetes sp.]
MVFLTYYKSGGTVKHRIANLNGILPNGLL